MVFALPAIGIFFIVIGIVLLITIITQTSATATSRASSEQRLTGQTSELESANTDPNLQGIVAYQLSNIAELEQRRKQRIYKTSFAFTAFLAVFVFIYFIAAFITFYLFQSNWTDLTNLKVLIVVAYGLGFFFLILSLLFSGRALQTSPYSSANLGSLGDLEFIEKLISGQQSQGATQGLKNLIAENNEKHRYLQTTKYLFFTTFINLVILAMLLAFHFTK